IDPAPEKKRNSPPGLAQPRPPQPVLPLFGSSGPRCGGPTLVATQIHGEEKVSAKKRCQEPFLLTPGGEAGRLGAWSDRSAPPRRVRLPRPQPRQRAPNQLREAR